MKFTRTFSQWIRKYAFELGLSNFVAVAAFLFFSGVVLKTQIQWVDHTYQVLTELFDLSSDFERAETSQRGYFISGDPEFVKNYHKAHTALFESAKKLTILVKDNKDQLARVEELTQNFHHRIAMMDEVIQLRSEGKKSKAEVLITNPARRKYAQDIRDGIQEVVSIERAFLADRLQKAAHTEKILIVLAIIGGLIASSLIVISRRIMKRDNRLLKESHDSLSKQEKLLESIINSMSEGLVVVDHQGTYIRVNKAAEKVIGPKNTILDSRDITKVIGFLDPQTRLTIPNDEIPSRRALRGEATNSFEILIVNALHPEGVFISTNARPILNDDGEVIAALSVFRDISRQKEIEKERILAREAAIEASRKKSDFLATMSHEIRTPMNGIIGMATLMMDSKMSSEQFEFVNTIKKSAESLLGLINGILDHSKIESGKLVLQKFDFDLRQVTEDVFEAFKYSAQEKNLKFEIAMDKKQKWTFNGDADRIRQVLINLVGNAIKFTEKGNVKIFAKRISGTGDKSRVRFEISDTGPGLSSEDSAQIFAKYIQTAVGQAKGGSGLGLMIAKQLAQLMSGDMGVQSQLGQGSTFWFELELDDIKDIAISTKIENEFPQLTGHVLIAEDQPVNVRVVSKFLEKMGLTYEVAENGKVAIELYEAGNFDLVLMDCRMPILSGYEATRKIRQHQTEKGERKPILALTAEGSSGDRKLCIESGMDEVLSKPLDLSRFITLLSVYLSKDKKILDPKALENLKGYDVQDEDLGLALIKDFMISAPKSVADIKKAAQAKDLNFLRDTAHGLKSTAATLGALRLSEKCLELESLSSLPANILDLCTELEKELALAKEALESVGRSSRKAS